MHREIFQWLELKGITMGIVQVRVKGQDDFDGARYYTEFLPRAGEAVQLPGPKLARVAEVIHPLRTQHRAAVVVPLLIVNLIDAETCGDTQSG
jgi:hypothetical protein